jgi:hypothetical protein
MSRDQYAGQNSNKEIGNKFFETLEQFKYLGTTLTNKNSIHEEGGFRQSRRVLN